LSALARSASMPPLMKLPRQRRTVSLHQSQPRSENWHRDRIYGRRALLRRSHGHHRDPVACRSSARAAFIVCLYRHVGVVTRRNELQAAVEAVVLRPSGGRAPASALNSFTVQMTIRSACPPSSHHVNRALSGRPLHAAPLPSDTLQSLRQLHAHIGIFKSP
jgi:hypothetical protein